jgi:triose/dihydroxyacetone kinase / FAD-AMP lyase (cyclizing)
MAPPAAAKKLINEPEDCVEEALQGLLLAHPSLSRLEGIHVVLRSDFEAAKQSQVALISGGGSGHEPAHAGYVGPGMLSAAVLGGVFASPSVYSILAAIRAVTGKGRGCLLIVKNYTGDRLNFGLAREQAMSEGLDVEMVVVADDCALPKSKGITGARGVAGTVLVHKVAGAAAAAGKSLAEVKAEAAAAAAAMGTLGVALSVCTVPGSSPSSRLDGAVFELGMGIHGEPGIAVLPLEPADALVDRMIQTIVGSGGSGGGGGGDQAHLPLAPNEDVVVLVNNLGATPPLELSILVRRAVAVLESAPIHARVHRIYTGSYMTSLEMAGASITILKVDDDPLRLARLDAPTAAPGWTTAEVRIPGQPPSDTPVPEHAEQESSGAPVSAEAWAGYVKGARAVAEALVKAKEWLNKLDGVGGDGDCGVTLERGARAVLAYVDENVGNPKSAADLLKGVAGAISGSMGGTSGALLEILFRAMARVLQEQEQEGAAPAASASAWAKALEVGVDRMGTYGGACAGMRTMLDAWLPASEALLQGQGLASAAAAARKGAEATREMAAQAGRANYVPAELTKGHLDPGAEAVALSLEALLTALSAGDAR